LCKTSFYQCILPKWTDTYAPVHTAHDKDIALSHQSFTAPIATAVQITRAINFASLLLGPKHTPKSKSKSLPLILPKIILKLY
jgi:hypothetical protein